MFPRTWLYAVGLLFLTDLSPCFGVPLAVLDLHSSLDLLDVEMEERALRVLRSVPVTESKFVTRCKEYQNDAKYIQPTSPVDCKTQAWPALESGINTGDYDNYINIMNIVQPRDMMVLWSGIGTKDYAENYADQHAEKFVLGQIFLGYCVDNLDWNDLGNFWTDASKAFAERASGVVTVVLNGSISGKAYRTDSTFGKTELPNMRQMEVTELHAIIIDAEGETCDAGKTIQELKNDVESRMWKWSCTNTAPKALPAQNLIIVAVATSLGMRMIWAH